MAQYTVLNDESIQTILIHYGIEKVTSYKILSGGSENTNYLINTNGKAFVLTVCEQKSVQEAEELASLLNYLERNNFSTSKLVKAKTGKLTVTFSNKPIILKEFIEGDILQDFPDNLLVYLGEELAKLHQVKVPNYVPKTLNYGSIDRFDEVQVYAPESSFYKWLKEVKTYIKKHMHPELPKSLIHSDIFYSNIIVSDDLKTGTIMDFEEACYYYRVFDIGMMIVGTCCQEETINLHKAKKLLKGYQQNIKLKEVEIEALQAFTIYGATATAFWRHQNFNYINVIPSMKNHYVSMKNLADSILSISINEFKTVFNK